MYIKQKITNKNITPLVFYEASVKIHNVDRGFRFSSSGFYSHVKTSIMQITALKLFNFNKYK